MVSVVNQTYKNFECIIVNDGSVDNTEEIILNWIKTDNRFKYYYQENSGLSKTRNKGIELSAGKYILPLDSDDKISNNYIEECVRVLETQNDVKIAYGASFVFGNKLKKWNLDKYNFEDLLYKNMIYCTGLFRKEDWEKVGGYDENLNEGLEDWEFWIHILKTGGKALKIDSCYFYYRIKEKSMITETITKHHYGYNSRVYIFEKHIELYRKTNFYDMYFENYRLKKTLANPHKYFSIIELILLIPKILYSRAKNLFNKAQNKLIP